MDELEEDLIAMVSHDLRAPLAKVVSSVEALASYPGLKENPKYNELVEIAVNSANHLRFLAESILEFSQVGVFQKAVNMKPIKVEIILTEALAYTCSSINKKAIEINVQISPGLPQVTVNANIICRVIINLIENGLKYTPEGGKMWVGARRNNDLLCIWVRDSGPGIQPSDQEQIFTKFSRLNPEISNGYGLGLAFCRSAVSAHGGRIWVESEPGRGATFLFTLPIADPVSNPVG